MENEKSKEKDLNYPLKLWALTLFVGAILFSLEILFIGKWQNIADLLYLLVSVTFWGLGIGFILGLPALIVVWSLYRGYILFTNSITLDYFITVILSILSVIFSFRFFLDSWSFNSLFIAYILATPIAACFLYIRRRKKKTANSIITTVTTSPVLCDAD